MDLVCILIVSSEFTPDADNLFYAPEGSTIIDNDIQLPPGTITKFTKNTFNFMPQVN